jgi:hypothetical protein
VTIESRKARLARHADSIGRCKMYTKLLLKSMKGEDNSEDLGINEKIILK